MITLGVPRTRKHSRTALPPANDQGDSESGRVLFHCASRRCALQTLHFLQTEGKTCFTVKKDSDSLCWTVALCGDPDPRLRCPPGTPVCGLTPLVSEPHVPQLQNLGIGKTTEDLNDSTNRGDLTHIQRTCHPTAEYECFPSAHGTSSRIGYAHINP